jgi:hypothetical protein
MRSPSVSPVKRLAAACTLAAFTLTAMPAISYAGMIGTAEALRAEASPARTANLARVAAAFEREDVRAQLVKFGVDPSEAAARAAALDDADLAKLAGRMDQLPAGGDGGLLAVIGIVFIVLLILDYVGVTKIFRR